MEATNTPTWAQLLRPDTLKNTGMNVLPPKLAEAVLSSRWDPAAEPATGVEPQRFLLLAAELLRMAGNSVKPFDPKYHNPEHFRGVCEGVREQLWQLQREGSSPSSGIRHSLLLAAAGHDWGHPGSTLRRDAPRGVPFPELSLALSNEMVSAIAVDAWAASCAVPLGVRGKGPQTEYEQILVCADIIPEEDFWRRHESGLEVTYGEIPAKPSPETFDKWVAGEIRFLSHVEENLTPPAHTLGWGSRVKRHRDRLAQASLNKDGSDWLRMQLAWERARQGTFPYDRGPAGASGVTAPRRPTLVTERPSRPLSRQSR